MKRPKFCVLRNIIGAIEGAINMKEKNLRITGNEPSTKPFYFLIPFFLNERFS